MSDFDYSPFSPIHRALNLIESLWHPDDMSDTQYDEYHELLLYTLREPILMAATDSETFLEWPQGSGVPRGKAWVYCEPKDEL